MTENRKIDASSWILPGVAVLVVVVLVIFALAGGPAQLDPDSPEGTVQQYLQAFNEQRFDEAVELVHEDWRGSCDGDDLEDWRQDRFSAELVEEGDFGNFGRFEEFAVEEPPFFDEGGPPEILGDTTVVFVNINHGGGGLRGGWTESTSFNLVDDGEFWWIVGDPWPYFVWSCT